MNSHKRLRFRLILPSFPPFNIYGRIAKTTTSLGPVYVGTAANKLDKWDVEIIDENNIHGWFCPKNHNGTLDHVKLQAERPAEVVGFYGSMTSAIPRMYKLAALYKKLGAKTIAGGYHVRNLPQESLDNNIDVVVMGEGEIAIKELLLAWENNTPLAEIPGLSFLHDGKMITTPKPELLADLDLLPFPDFNLVRYAKIKIYPIGRIRGCNMNCEFCAVKDRARCSTPEWMIAQIAHLVETRGARYFFDVSDHFVASGLAEAVHFCQLLADYQKQHGLRIRMSIQIRLSDARHPELLQAMRAAGIDNVCIGIESCIDEELLVMQKGYREKDVLNWMDIYHRFGFFIHGMMIFGYPEKPNHRINLPLKTRVQKFKEFVRQLDTAQVLLPVPLPGTELTERLNNDGRLYDIGYEYYDGQFPLFEPDEGITPEELQQAVQEIMGEFYRFSHIWHLIKAYCFYFPLVVFPRTATLATFRVRYITNGYRQWHRLYFRNWKIRFLGSIIVRNWKMAFRRGNFKEQLARAKARLVQMKTNQ